MKLLKQIGVGISHINKWLFILSALLIAWMTLTVTMDVVLRTFTGASVMWVLQICEYAMVGMTFAGAAWVLEDEGHVSVDFIPEHLTTRTRSLLNFITSIVGIALCAIITWIGVIATKDSYVEHVTYMAALRVPRAYVMFIIPLGSFMLTVQFIRRAYGFWQRWKE